MHSSYTPCAVAVFALMTAALPARAQTLPPPAHVVSLSSSASAEVTKDLLAITFTATREGADPQSVQAALKQALDAALAEARRVHKPGQIDVRSGNFTLLPRHAPKGGAITGWQGTAELVAEGRDLNGIAQLAGRIQTMTIARVAQGLSREAREKVDGEVTAQAIARFRAQAAEIARAFGYAGYTLREVNVAGNEAPPHLPVMRMQAMAKAEDAALPVEAGQAVVSATVSGSVTLTR
jgi:predicted secreted protein